MAKSKNNKGSANDGLALIIGGLFVLALVFATYSYFNKTPAGVIEEEVKSSTSDRLSDASEASETTSLGDRIKELFSSGETTGEVGDAMATDLYGNDEDIDESTATGTGGPKVLYSVWTATDYQQGDITSNSYVVQPGDTLWEIAEAKYGNGADWTRILEANMDSVGYLPGGQQALIQVGQSIVLP